MIPGSDYTALPVLAACHARDSPAVPDRGAYRVNSRPDATVQKRQFRPTKSSTDPEPVPIETPLLERVVAGRETGDDHAGQTTYLRRRYERHAPTRGAHEKGLHRCYLVGGETAGRSPLTHCRAATATCPPYKYVFRMYVLRARWIVTRSGMNIR